MLRNGHPHKLQTMSNYVFDIYEDGEFFDRVSTRARSYGEAEDQIVEEFGCNVELVRIERA